MASVIAGGLSPLIPAELLRRTGGPTAIALYIIGVSVIMRYLFTWHRKQLTKTFTPEPVRFASKRNSMDEYGIGLHAMTTLFGRNNPKAKARLFP